MIIMDRHWINNYHTQHIDSPPQYKDIAGYADNPVQTDLNDKLYNLDEKFRNTLVELDTAKAELKRLKSYNKTLERKIEEGEEERSLLQGKAEALKAKLGVFNASVGKCNDEKERLRTSLNESQVTVARLEERLLAASTQLDKYRDPANQDSNVSIKKNVINNKKEIKKLRAQIENDKIELDKDHETARLKEEEVKNVEQELENLRKELRLCEEEKISIQQEEADERAEKDKLIKQYKLLTLERTTYEGRLKDARVQLGVKRAGKNVNMKLSDDMQITEKDLQKHLNILEKRLKDAMADLDILRNRHRMSKTAMSINNYTRRNQTKRGTKGKVSLANSGIGNVQFTTKTSKAKSQPDTTVEANKKLNSKSKIKGSKGSLKSKASQKENDTDRSSLIKVESTNKTNDRVQELVGKGDKKSSVQFVPQPKAKLKIATSIK